MSVLLDRLVAAIPDNPERIDALCVAVTDWPALVESSARDGVLGILRRELGRREIPLPADAHALMERLHASQALWQANVIRALDAALDALEAGGIRAVVLKGPALVERFYPDPSLRFSSDLDILVADADTDRAVAALKPLGYSVETGVSARYARRHHHHL
ncbi:MAG TPA: nucleotidyltransferase family protein, partial [Methylomirabilota bacterium]